MTTNIAPVSTTESGRAARTAPVSAMGRNAAGLILGKGAQTGLGFLFWVIAARLFSEAEVGLVAAMVAATMLSVQFAIIGVDAAFISLHPLHPDRRGALLGSAVALVTVTSLVAGGAILTYAAISTGDFGALVANPLTATVFLLGSLLGTYVVLFERVSVARKRGHEVFVRNLANGFISLVPFFVVWRLSVNTGSTPLFMFWLGGVSAAFILCLRHNNAAVGQARRAPSDGSRDRFAVDRELGGDLVRVGLPNYVLATAERLPMLALPIIIVSILGATTSAHWYTSWQMAFAVYSVPIAVGTALFAEGAGNRDGLESDARKALTYALALAVPGAIAAALVAPFALGVLGAGYADAGTTPLRILLLGVVPFIFIQVYFAVCRATRRLREASILAAAIAAASIGGVVVVASRYGLDGIAIHWVVCIGVGSLWAIPRTVHLLRTTPSDQGAL